MRGKKSAATARSTNTVSAELQVEGRWHLALKTMSSAMPKSAAACT